MADRVVTLMDDDDQALAIAKADGDGGVALRVNGSKGVTVAPEDLFAAVTYVLQDTAAMAESRAEGLRAAASLRAARDEPQA